ncbi:RNA 2',3'-cyclic phosphodiesterase [Candidatus Pacearchaeota archaeon]|nr:RNA 2',3'-cyclic phosphodiesterase [Candidatus Pacearchaeota archaeon]
MKEIRRRLREIKLKSFKAKLGGVGVFSKEFVRIIWVKLNNCDELQREVDKVLKSLFTQEKRFMSHLTIARVKKVSDKKKLFGFLDRIKVKEIVFEVKSFELMKSELFPKGPKYDVIGKFALL